MLYDLCLILCDLCLIYIFFFSDKFKSTGHTRADTIISGIISQPAPNDPSSTLLTMINLVDPKGSIPIRLIKQLHGSGMDEWIQKLIATYGKYVKNNRLVVT